MCFKVRAYAYPLLFAECQKMEPNHTVHVYNTQNEGLSKFAINTDQNEIRKNWMKIASLIKTILKWVECVGKPPSIHSSRPAFAHYLDSVYYLMAICGSKYDLITCDLGSAFCVTFTIWSEFIRNRLCLCGVQRSNIFLNRLDFLTPGPIPKSNQFFGMLSQRIPTGFIYKYGQFEQYQRQQKYRHFTHLSYRLR